MQDLILKNHAKSYYYAQSHKSIIGATDNRELLQISDLISFSLISTPVLRPMLDLIIAYFRPFWHVVPTNVGMFYAMLGPWDQ
jgi:hypothetical protein